MRAWSKRIVVDYNTAPFVIQTSESLRSALCTIDSGEIGAICCLNDDGVMEGILTDGDLRRWLIGQGRIDLDRPVADSLNRRFRFASVDDPPDRIAALTEQAPRLLPVLDQRRRLVAVARQRQLDDAIRIGQREIGEGRPVLIIAEIGNNHNGDLELARQLVDAAKAAGADCAKFQMRQMASLYINGGNPDDPRADLGTQYTLDLLARFQLSDDDLFRMFDYCRSKDLIPLCTPWDEESATRLDAYGMPAFKVASADLCNHQLLTQLCRTGKPLLLSTGMSTENEILDAVELLKRQMADYALLHCNSTYPTPFHMINLKYLDRLRQIGACPVGYSGHERGYSVPIAAVARGACIVEKHLTLDRTMEGNDHKVSLLPFELSEMVVAIRQVEEAMGTSEPRRLSQGEIINRETLGKSLVAVRPIRAGQTIQGDMVAIRSPGRGLPPYRLKELIGHRIRRAMEVGDFFYPGDLQDSTPQPRRYGFDRPWGIPVRHHDYADLIRCSNLDFVEFHLSFKDLKLEVDRYFRDRAAVGLVVHAPEQFENDHILDLCAEDDSYWQRSLDHMRRVIALTVSLRPFFTNSAPTQIVTNVGGFSMNAPLSEARKAAALDRLKTAFARVGHPEVEIIIQTMPPFPWHCGGQRYHNLFIDPEQIAEFCSASGVRVCLDISHAQLACTRFGWSLRDYVRTVGPHTAHLHLADADGVDGEGMQIGEGIIDFGALADTLRAVAPAASFLPEIWQGHKNGGEGFWMALDKLEHWFGKAPP